MRVEALSKLDAAAQVDVVVVNYRTPDDLEDFLLSLLLNTSDEDTKRIASITVVNVDSTDEDRDRCNRYLATISSLVTRSYDVINIPWNCGYAIACNTASHRGEADILAFFNADTRVDVGVLDRCVKAFIDNPTWGVVGPKQVDDKGKITHAGVFGPDTAPELRGWRKNGASTEYNDVRDDCYSVSGSAYFIRRSLWDAMRTCPTFVESREAITSNHADGAFLPTPHYYEETYLSVHVRSHGWKIAYLGDVEMVHKWHKASPVGGRVEKDLLPVSRRMFREACKHHGIAHD